MKPTVYTREMLLYCLKRAARAIGKSPRPFEYAKYWMGRKYHRKPPPRRDTIRDHFGDWAKALEAAELPPLPAIDETSIVRCLLIATVQVGHTPNTAEYDDVYARGEPGVWISRQTIIGEYRSWRNALSAAGLTPGANCRKSRQATVKPVRSGTVKARTPSTRKAANPNPPILDDNLIEMIVLLTEAGEAFDGARGKRSKRANNRFDAGMALLATLRARIASRATKSL